MAELGFSLVLATLGLLLGSLITWLVAKYYFQRAGTGTRAMLRTFAVSLEQLFPGKVVFLRGEKGEIDLSKPGRITGKLTATVPSPKVAAEGTIRPDGGDP